MTRMRGFTLVDLVLLLAVLVVFLAVVHPMLASMRLEARTRLDAQQVRTLHQGMIVWVQPNGDDYPLPSRLDKQNYTVPEEGRAKDTTANIDSIMIATGAIAPSHLISPLEVNPNVVEYQSYEYDLPTGSVDPSKAIWDPKLSAALDGTSKGNVSYAHLQPSGGRMTRWANTFAEGEMILGTRGPQIGSVVRGADGTVTPMLSSSGSNTLRFFENGRAWSGNIAFNDNHVDFLRNWLAPGKPFVGRGRVYHAADGTQWPDVWCYDEPDDPKAANDYLGIFIKAGETPAEFKAAWD